MIQQQVQEVFVERSLLVRQENIARRNYKIGNWLKLLSLHEQNHDRQAVDHIIRQELHENFVMQEGFWLAEASKRLGSETTRQDIELLMLAFDDGHYTQLATVLAEHIVKMYNQKQLTENFTLSILEKFIALFSFGVHSGVFFKLMRSIYTAKGAIAKVRSCFERELRLAHDDLDLVWDQYKLWEPQSSLVEKNSGLYQEAKATWEKRSEEFDEDICSKTNVKLSLVNLESLNESKIDEDRYMQWIEQLQTEAEKLWFLRRIVLNYRQLFVPYLIKLEIFYQNDEDSLMKKYKVAIRLSDNSSQIELKYLRFLARRISKHLLNEPLPENYNQQWAANVTFFREEIASLIAKQRVAVSKEQMGHIFRDYYNLWIEVEQNIVRDKESVSQLYENLIKQTLELEVFEAFADSLVALGAIKEARNILKRYVITASFNQKSKERYVRFIEVYGDVEDQMKFYHETHQMKGPKRQEETISYGQQTQLIVEHKRQPSQTGQTQLMSEKPPKDQAGQGGQNLKRPHPSQRDEVQDKIYENMRKRVHVDGDHTVYLKGISTSWGESDILKSLKYPEDVVRVSLVTKNNEQKDYCYIEYKTKESAEREVHDNKNDYKMYMSKPPAEYDQNNTLFVCALPQSANQQKIKDLFGAHQDHIADVRLKIDKDKNYAYVEFASVSEKEAAFEEVKKHPLVIDGKKIIVQHCDSSRAKHKKFVPVVFLKNLAFKAQEKDIRQFFEGKAISKLLIPLSDKNRPQGFAYVEFEKFKDYQDALDMRKGTLFGREFSILRSDRQITESHTQKRKDSHEKDTHHRPARSQQRLTNKEGQQSQTEAKDNSYFSNLFK